MFSLARRIAENPPNYTCHAAWSSPLWQHGLTKWFTCFLSWIGATPLISQHYKGWGGSLDFQKNQYWYHMLNSTVPACSQTLCRCSSEILLQLPINILEGKRHRDESCWSWGTVGCSAAAQRLRLWESQMRPWCADSCWGRAQWKCRVNVWLPFRHPVVVLWILSSPRIAFTELLTDLQNDGSAKVGNNRKKKKKGGEPGWWW